MQFQNFVQASFQAMVNCWFGARFLGSSYPRKWKGLLLRGTPVRIPNQRAPNQLLTISWSLSSTCFRKNLDDYIDYPPAKAPENGWDWKMIVSFLDEGTLAGAIAVSFRTFSWSGHQLKSNHVQVVRGFVWYDVDDFSKSGHQTHLGITTVWDV